MINSLNQWSDLLQNSLDSERYIYLEKKTQDYFLADKSYASNDSEKLSVKAIINITRSLFQLNNDMHTARKVAAVLIQISQRIEEKYLSSLFTAHDWFMNCVTLQGIGTSATIAKCLAEQLIRPQPIEYKKGDIKTRDIVPTEKEILGEGAYGKVYVHLNNKQLVVKKSHVNIAKEYKIGLELDHPCLVKPHYLFIKKYSNGTSKYQMVMEKIDGCSIRTLDKHEKKLTCEQILMILIQAKGCCIYLYNQNVVWGDVNRGNIFLTNDNRLMICDFGCWRIEREPINKATGLLGCTMNIIDLLIYYSLFKEIPIAIKKSITEPSELFEKNILKSDAKARLHSSDDERIKLLEEYFDTVISRLKEYSTMF